MRTVSASTIVARTTVGSWRSWRQVKRSTTQPAAISLLSRARSRSNAAWWPCAGPGRRGDREPVVDSYVADVERCDLMDLEFRLGADVAADHREGHEGAGRGEPPQCGGGFMAQDGVVAGIQQRCGLVGGRRQGRVADREHTPVHAMQRPGAHPMLDGLGAEPQREQLPARDQSVLSSRQRCQRAPSGAGRGQIVKNQPRHSGFFTRRPSSAHNAPDHQARTRFLTKSPSSVFI
jgi:hypothetical protein